MTFIAIHDPLCGFPVTSCSCHQSKYICTCVFDECGYIVQVCPMHWSWTNIREKVSKIKFDHLKKENEKLKTALEEIVGIIDNIGIYPAAVVDTYEERTPYMDGWNAGVSSVTQPIAGIIDTIESLIDSGE